MTVDSWGTRGTMGTTVTLSQLVPHANSNGQGDDLYQCPLHPHFTSPDRTALCPHCEEQFRTTRRELKERRRRRQQSNNMGLQEQQERQQQQNGTTAGNGTTAPFSSSVNFLLTTTAAARQQHFAPTSRTTPRGVAGASADEQHDD